MDSLLLLDANIRVVDPVGDDILGEGPTAVLHPRFYEAPADALPCERNPESAAAIPVGEGEWYLSGIPSSISVENRISAMGCGSSAPSSRIHFFVASDDLARCRSVFAGDSNVLVPDRESEREGLQLMVACKACVISNSTYGWWGAWLSDRALVVAPDPWLGDQHWNCLPSRWVTIPAPGLNTARRISK